MISAVKTNKKFKNIESPKMVSKRLYGHYLRSYEQIKNFQSLKNLSAISPEETARKFLDGKAVSAPQKLGDFSKKMLTKNNDFTSKNPLDVTHVLRSCNPYLTLSLRGPATQHLHNEARSAELWWVDGWVGGDFLPPWIFFIFKYNNKQDELLPKMCLKVAFAY